MKSYSFEYKGVDVYVNCSNGKGTISSDYWETGTKHLLKDFKVPEYTTKKRNIAVNGGLFYTYDNKYYACGIEKVNGQVHQDWDTEYDDVCAIGIKSNGTPVIDTQANIKANLSTYKHAVTGAFGLMKNGSKYLGNYKKLGSYTKMSGRTLVGWSSTTNKWVIISFEGETGESGLTGSQCYDLIQYINSNYSLKITDCLCMDGGGSVGLIVNEVQKITTSRKIKNAIIIYDDSDDEEEEEEYEMGTLKMKCTKGQQAIREEIEFKYNSTKKCYQPCGTILEILPKGNTECIITGFVEGLQKDGYQWVKVKHDDVEGYAQWDSMYFEVYEIKK